MRILGIDPGLANTGWGIVDFDGFRFRPVSYGTVRTEASEILERRIAFIADRIGKTALDFGAEHVSIEDIFFAKNEVSAIGVAKVIGAVSYSLYRLDIPISVFTPLQIKAAITGNGRAEKNQVQEMVRLLMGLESIPKPDHAADALAAAVCYGNTSTTLGKLGVGR